MKIETHYVELKPIMFKEMETKTHYKGKLEVKEMCKTQKENKMKDPQLITMMLVQLFVGVTNEYGEEDEEER